MMHMILYALRVHSGKVSRTWILDLDASLHVTPHKEWFTCHEETIVSVTLGDSYSCDIVGIGDIAMVLSNGYKFIIENVCHMPLFDLQFDFSWQT